LIEIGLGVIGWSSGDYHMRKTAFNCCFRHLNMSVVCSKYIVGMYRRRAFC
jgi:hypothetical protein